MEWHKMKKNILIQVTEPKDVGAVVRYRLLTANGTLFIRDFDTVDELYNHILWLVECGTMVERLRVEQIHGTKYIREIEVVEAS